MGTTTIKLKDHVSCNMGVTPDEAKPIYDMILEAFKDKVSVVLDFEDIEMMTTAFLNVVIGNLYENYKGEELKEMLKFNNLTQPIAVRIKKVTDNAKLFYSDSKRFTKNVEDTINENN